MHRLLGRTAAVAERRDRACEHFEDALRRHVALGCGPQLARKRCDYAALLLSGMRADRAQARLLLREAYAAARDFGMERVASGAGQTR